jgi:hypothetical protein
VEDIGFLVKDEDSRFPSRQVVQKSLLRLPTLSIILKAGKD